MIDISHLFKNVIYVDKDSNKQNYLFYLLQRNVLSVVTLMLKD